MATFVPATLPAQGEKAPTVVLPMTLPTMLPIAGDGAYGHKVTLVEVAPRARPPVQPLSFNVVSPNTLVAKTPSGLTVVAPAPGSYGPSPEDWGYRHSQSRNYAPPTFHVIGEPSTQHMSRSVKLTHGVAMPEGYNPGPKVVWLDDKGRALPQPEQQRQPQRNIYQLK